MKPRNGKPSRPRALALLAAVAGAVAGAAIETNSEAPEKGALNAGAPTARTLPYGNSHIHFVDTAEEHLPMVLFIHGTPGSWRAFRELFEAPELRGRVRLVAVDRPGFGRSNGGELVLGLQRQAASLKPLLDRNRSGRKAILVGHSLGGPIAARAAMDYPERVGGLLLVAPSLDPELQKTKWYQALGRMTPIRWLVPKPLQKANRELKGLRDDLRAMLPLWKEIAAPTIVIQGGRDGLVHPGNADFVRRMLPKGQAEVWLREDLNHFIPWKRPDLLVAGILELLDRAP